MVIAVGIIPQFIGILLQPHFHPPSNLPSLFLVLYIQNAMLDLCRTQHPQGVHHPPFPILLGEVEVLLGDTSTDERRLGAGVVNILVQDLGGGVGNGHGLSGSDLLIDVRTGLLVDGLELLLSGDCPVDDVLLQTLDRVVGASHALDLLTGTVRGAGVGHGVASVPVGDILEDHGAVAGIGPLLAVLDRGLDGEAVHAVDLETGDVLATLVVIREGGRPVCRRTHTVLVVCDLCQFFSPNQSTPIRISTYSHSQTAQEASTASPC